VGGDHLVLIARYQSRNEFSCWRWLSQTPGGNPRAGKARSILAFRLYQASISKYRYRYLKKIGPVPPRNPRIRSNRISIDRSFSLSCVPLNQQCFRWKRAVILFFTFSLDVPRCGVFNALERLVSDDEKRKKILFHLPLASNHKVRATSAGCGLAQSGLVAIYCYNTVDGSIRSPMYSGIRTLGNRNGR